MISDVVVQYGDQNNKTRWGYVTAREFKMFSEYHEKSKQLKEDTENEVLRADVKKRAEVMIKVYLPDGTTGDASFQSIFPVEPFAKYQIKNEA